MISRWLPPVLVYAAMFWMSGRSPSELPAGIPDIIPHFLEFFILGFLTARAARPRSRSGWIWVLLLLLALGDEFHQFFLPNRACSLKDVFVDSLGALAGLYLWGRITKGSKFSFH